MKESIIPGGADRSKCYLCWRPDPEHRHHLLHGSRRQKAEEYGLTVWICWKCHKLLHDKGEHDLELERVAQRVFEKRYGHELWMREFGQDYLE